jgi:hypothetical protein
MLKSNSSKPAYKVIALSALATVFFCGITAQSAFAADSKAISKDMATEAPADADFKKLDVNSDHKLSLKEAVKDKSLASNFDATDANKDGSVSAEEYAGYKSAMQAKVLDSTAAPASTPPTAAPTAAAPAKDTQY